MIFFSPDIRKLVKKNNLPGLLKCLDHRRAEVRYSAFVALTAGGRTYDNQIMTKLRNMVNDPDPWVKTIAIITFADLGDPSISDNLMEIIIEGSRNARIDLLKIIAKRGVTDDKTIMEVIINALTDKQELVRRQAIIAAGETRNTHLVPYLAESLHKNHHALRILTAKALSNIGGEGGVAGLVSLLTDRNPEVREEARTCLATAGYEFARKALHETGISQLVEGMKGSEPVRKKTARKIGEDAIMEGLPLLHRACSDMYKGVRIEALKSIGVFKNPSSIDFIAKLLHDTYREVRLEAVHALEQIIDARSLKALEVAFNDRDAVVRESAYKVYLWMKPLI